MNTHNVAVAWSTRLSGNSKGFLLMAAAIACSIGVDGAAKLVDGDLPLSVMITVRAMMTIALFIPFLMIKGTASLRTRKPGMHVFRGILWYGTLFMVFFAVRNLTIAEVNAIIFIEPLVTLVLAAIFLGEMVSPRKIAAVVLGLFGVCIVMWPQFAETGFSSGDGAMRGALAAIGVAFSFASMAILCKRMVETENSVSMLFYPQWVGLILFGGFALWQWTMPSGMDLFYILLLTLFALAANYLFLSAMRVADPGAIAPAVYIALPFSVVLDIVVFGDWPTTALWIGSALVVGSALVAERKDS